MDTMTRSEALSLGLTRYSNGVPCRRGHVPERYSSNGMCCECLKVPAKGAVRVSLLVPRGARKLLESYAKALMLEAGLLHMIPVAKSAEELAYRKVVENHRRNGCPEDRLPRSFGGFTLPDGEMP